MHETRRPHRDASDIGRISGEALLKPPLARREPIEHVLHGDRRIDHYAWLRHKENAEVNAYLEAENAYTSTVLKPTKLFEARLHSNTRNSEFTNDG